MHVISVPQVVPIPQEATVPHVAILPQVVTKPKTSRTNSAGGNDDTYDFGEPKKSSKSSDITEIIDCVTSSGYQARSSSEECFNMNDDNFENRMNSKSNIVTNKKNELDKYEQNENIYYNKNIKRKKTLPYTGSHYSKSSNDGYDGTLSRSNFVSTTKSNSATNGGSNPSPSTPSNGLSTLTDREIDTTRLYEPIDQKRFYDDTNSLNNDDRNSIGEPEPESKLENSSYEGQADVPSISNKPDLSPYKSRFFASSLSSLSQDYPYDDISEFLITPHDTPISENSMSVNAGSTTSINQSDLTDFDLENEFPLPTSQTLPNLSFTDDYTEIFGSTQPNYGTNFTPESNFWTEMMHSSSMPAFQDQSNTAVNEIESSGNGNSVEYEQSIKPSTIDEANTVIMPEDQSGSEPSAEEMQFFEDEANDENE